MGHIALQAALAELIASSPPPESNDATLRGVGYRQAMTTPRFAPALPLLAVLGSVTALGIGT